MKKWTLLSLLFPLFTVAAERTPSDAPMMDVLYILRDRYCMRDGSTPSDAASVPLNETGLILSPKGVLTSVISVSGDLKVDVKYAIEGNKLVNDRVQGQSQVRSVFRVNDRDLTLLMPAYGACGDGEKIVAVFDTDGQNIHEAYRNALNTGFPYDLNWAIDTNNPEGYTLKYVGFKSETPNIVAIDQVELKAKDSLEMVKKLGERANRCLDVTIDEAAKTITVKPRDFIFVDSKHIENSTYAVEGKPAFTLETNNEQRERYFCIIRPDLIEAEWQKKAFADYLQGPYIPPVIPR